MASLFPEAFSQSILVTVAGMALVFAALGILMLIISGLERLYREKPAPAVQPLVPAARPLPEVEVGVDLDVDEEVAVAIAVALAVWKRREETLPAPKTTVVTFAPGTSAWQALGRLS